MFYDSGRWDHYARGDRKIVGSIGDEGLQRVAVSEPSRVIAHMNSQNCNSMQTWTSSSKTCGRCWEREDQFAFIVWPLLDHPSRKPYTQEDLSSTNCTCLASKSLCRLELLSFCLYFLSSSVTSIHYHTQPRWYFFAQENTYNHPRCPKWFPPLHIYNGHPLENSFGILYYLKSRWFFGATSLQFFQILCRWV